MPAKLDYTIALKSINLNTYHANGHVNGPPVTYRMLWRMAMVRGFSDTVFGKLTNKERKYILSNNRIAENARSSFKQAIGYNALKLYAWPLVGMTFAKLFLCSLSDTIFYRGMRALTFWAEKETSHDIAQTVNKYLGGLVKGSITAVSAVAESVCWGVALIGDCFFKPAKSMLSSIKSACSKKISSWSKRNSVSKSGKTLDNENSSLNKQEVSDIELVQSKPSHLLKNTLVVAGVATAAAATSKVTLPIVGAIAIKSAITAAVASSIKNKRDRIKSAPDTIFFKKGIDQEVESTRDRRYSVEF
ncbi:hypothetical protein L3V82_04235 [Thiotrichales bacterium 19S3-7]|nr:hypothetical protein [Thiotrichales bacterium 19S3-7]MCF6802680.1 hypothetical protein [Thiotrichales bacterium 19S3-11]